MAKVYQPKRDNWIPNNLYMQIIYCIRDYERKKNELESIILESPTPPDGMPRGSGIGDPTASKAQKYWTLKSEVDAVEKALEALPEYSREPIMASICEHKAYPSYASPSTFSKLKGRLIRRVGVNLGLLTD